VNVVEVLVSIKGGYGSVVPDATGFCVFS